MGYDVRANSIKIRIPLASEAEAFAALVKYNLEVPDSYKRGSGPEDKRWFSWMEADFNAYENLRNFLENLGFGYVPEGDDLVVSSWHGDKQGQEALLFEVLAPFVVHGSHANWVGEDCRRYRWEFLGGSMFVRAGSEEWESESFKPADIRAREVSEINDFVSLWNRVHGSPS